MNILFLAHLPLALDRRSAEHPAPWVIALAEGLSRAGNACVTILSHHRRAERGKVCHIGGVHVEYVPKYEPTRTDPWHGYWPAYMQFRSRVEKFAPDLIVGFGSEQGYGLTAARLARRFHLPGVIFIQGIIDKLATYTPDGHMRKWARRRMESRALRAVNGIVAETRCAADWARSTGTEARVVIIPHALTASFLDATPAFDRPNIICVGSLNCIKGADVVLESIPRMREKCHFRFLGDGPLRPEMEKRVIEAGFASRVEFSGKVSHVEIRRAMESASLLVIGSRMDTSPNVITEAHAAGIPVVGSAAGGIPEMIDDGIDGYVVPPEDPRAMARRMDELLADPSLAARMGAAGRKKVRVLNDPARIARAHLDFYGELMEGFKATPKAPVK